MMGSAWRDKEDRDGMERDRMKRKVLQATKTSGKKVE